MNTRPIPQMSELEIKSNLCYYDPRNQSDNLGADEDEDYPQPRNKCSCDNCFYGRDKLAIQLLQARGQRDRLAADLRIIADGTSCRECGGEDQALLAREALQSLFCDALQCLIPNADVDASPPPTPQDNAQR